ncbi:hypothetical protein [Pseudarthrobacter sp. C4D7]|uniref:hypothetical protein n=1 Tax=Pseudarthrobacter sp. C4D7 TaxID=2735268 RepID=UPI0015852553|nr:hypothetical protein [Pseudarthrobacter sp. C4D7]NUT70867.1 hypothetical protein [Pseudarthrobacter sp. C4D7]
MGAIFGTALSLMLTVGGAAVAALGGPGASRNYLVGHVLLGVGIGLMLSMALRAGARFIIMRTVAQAPGAPMLPPAVDAAAVSVLPVRSASTVPLRGRHAA